MFGKTKKIIALMSCIAITVSILAGCGGNKKQEANNSQIPESTKSQSAQDGKNKISLPYTGEQTVYSGYAADLGIKQKPDAPVTKEYLKKVGNVKIEWQTGPWSDYNEKIKVFLSSGDMPDIVWMGDLQKNIFTYGPTGLFLNWEKYKEYMPNWQEYVSKYPSLNYLLAENGERYAITDIEPIDMAQESWYYNKTLLDKHGVQVPNTFDDLLAAMRKIKKEDPSIIPFQTYWNLSYTKNIMSQILDAYTGIFFNNKSGKWEFALGSADSHYKELVDLLATLYKEKLINPEIATMSWEQENAAISSNKWAFTFLYTIALEDEIYKTRKLPVEIKHMLPPSNNGKRNLSLTTIHDSMPGWGYFASTKVKNPELLATYIDYVVSKEASELFNWGIEGLTFTKDGSGKKSFKPEFLDGTKKLVDLGVGDFFDTRYIQLKDRQCEIERLGPLGKESSNINNGGLKDGTITPRFSKPTPMFTDAENQEISTIMTAINTFIEENEAKFILGSKSMSDWDNFVKKVNSMGNIDKVLEIYNNAKQINLDANRIYDAK